MKKARGLDRADLIPDKWKSASIYEEDAAELSLQIEQDAAALRARIASASSSITNEEDSK
jgi:hypothetical protein